MLDLEETQGNQTAVNGTPDNNGAVSIENIMGNMAGEAAPEATPDGNNAEGNANQQQDVEMPAWMQQLPKELRDNADTVKQLSKFNTIGDVAKSYSELESKMGKSLIQPGKDASAEEKEAFFRKLGKPESADGYGIDDENAKIFKDIAHANNLSVEQAQNMYKALNETGKQIEQQQQYSIARQAAATQAALLLEYGNNYNEKIQMLQRGVQAYGGKELGEKLKATGLIADLDVVKMFIKLGEQNAEAGTATRQQSHDSYRSFSDGGSLSFGNDFK